MPYSILKQAMIASFHILPSCHLQIFLPLDAIYSELLGKQQGKARQESIEAVSHRMTSEISY
jgi:hypothetical protein